MNHIIENDNLKLTVAEHGAEIKSLIRKCDNREMMWQADSAYWGRTAPVLFPVVGSYYQKKSIYEGKTYEMGQHGFARDMEFSLVSKEADKLVFELNSDDSTHEKYPFDFNLVITYILAKDSVKVCWDVKNIDERKMYFSIGAHPAFNCNLDTDYLRFEKNGKAINEITANIIASDGSGCLSDAQDRYTLENGVLKMSDKLFSKDALVIEGQQADKVTILDEKKK
ncbi:MAG: aldose 1-epimerase family protein, partial [Butyrivibrio sp.]|nr:aldose 1-epimerase family protein [Butyrivibrio sp.]